MKLAPSDGVAVIALVTSLFALYQTREANSPRMVVTPVAERSYLTCNTVLGRRESRSVIRFNISNVGGRTATLERIVATPSSEPVVVSTSEGTKPPTEFTLGRIDNLGQLPEGAASPSWDLAPVFVAAKPVLLANSGTRGEKLAPPLLNIPIEAGKAVTLDFALAVPDYEGLERVESVSLALLARFGHGEELLLRSTAETARVVWRGGYCRKASQ